VGGGDEQGGFRAGSDGGGSVWDAVQTVGAAGGGAGEASGNGVGIATRVARVISGGRVVTGERRHREGFSGLQSMGSTCWEPNGPLIFQPNFSQNQNRSKPN
jgi:hypothetical protein